MNLKRESRTPGQAYGSTAKNPGHSLRAHTASPSNEITWNDWLLYERASVTLYTPGEPRELSEIRADLDNWLTTIADMNARGQVPILPHVVWRALRYAGWLQ